MVHLFGSAFIQWEIAWALDSGCSDCGNEPNFELKQWRIVWIFISMIWQSDLQFGTLANDLIIGSVNISFHLTIACTSYVCVKEFCHGSPFDSPSDMLLVEVNANVHMTPYLPMLVKMSSFSLIISVQALYAYACSVPGNTYLQPMAECSGVEMMSCNFLYASASDWMVWKIAWDFCSVCTVKACTSQYPVFTRFARWSTMGQPTVVLPTVISGELALQLTWDPGDSIYFSAAYVVAADDENSCLSIPWDPGGPPIHCHILLLFIIGVWDPDGCTSNWLGGKPNFMGEGLSAYYFSTTALWVINHWQGPPVILKRQRNKLYKEDTVDTGRTAWTERRLRPMHGVG